MDMREVAKSMLGFSWAVSLFGFQQLSKVITSSPPQPQNLTVAEVEEVSRAVQSHLFGAAAMQFRAGDEWQRRLVDVIFDAASMQSLDPRKIAQALDPRTLLTNADPRKIVETGMTVIQQTMDKAVETVKQAAAAVTPPAQA
jgi:hypothetical protein